MSASLEEFRSESSRYLRDVYLARLERAVEVLPPGDLWWRPHDGALAVGNILLHLEGNVRQWILSGIGGAPDHRDRSSEFAAREGPDAATLLSRLRETVRAAAELVDGLDEAGLARSHGIQGTRVTAMAAVYHVVEHFSWHTAQAVWIAKARAGARHGLTFYDDSALARARNTPAASDDATA